MGTGYLSKVPFFILNTRFPMYQYTMIVTVAEKKAIVRAFFFSSENRYRNSNLKGRGGGEVVMWSASSSGCCLILQWVLKGTLLIQRSLYAILYVCYAVPPHQVKILLSQNFTTFPHKNTKPITYLCTSYPLLTSFPCPKLTTAHHYLNLTSVPLSKAHLCISVQSSPLHP